MGISTWGKGCGPSSILTGTFKGVVACTLLLIVLTSLFAIFLATKYLRPDAVVTVQSIIGLASLFAGSALGARPSGQRGWLIGLSIGLVCAAAMLMSGRTLDAGSGFIDASRPIAVVIGTCVIGGVAGVNL